MKRFALIACCFFAFGCGEDPEEGRPAERSPDHLGLSPGDDPGDAGTEEGEDDDSTDGAQVCGAGTTDGEQPRSSRMPSTTRPLVPAAPGDACTESDESD